MGINNRVFGSDIDPKIKEKLKKRQEVANIPDPNISVEDYHSSFNTLADLSSRTPFARMWTAVQLQKLGSPKLSKDYGPDKKSKWPSLKERKAHWDEFKVFYLKIGKDVMYREVIPEGSKILSIGNHILNTLPTEDPNTPRDSLDRVIPSSQQTNKNEFMMPPEGITSVTSATEGMLGAIKRTTVNFIVNNFHDYEQIYSKYFLKPGARLFVDFGWDTAYLYDPNKLLEKDEWLENIEEEIYGDGGYITKSAGDLDTIIGVVTNFDSKVRENGSIECNVELVSNNAALFSRDVDNRLKKLIYHSLDIEILRYAAAGYIGTNNDASNRILDRSKNWSLSTERKAGWEKIFFDFAQEKLKSTDNFPSGDAVKLGVFYKQSDNSKSLYISWGFFEDKILNKHLGFGETEKDISKSSMKTEPKYDSFNSFARYDENLMKSQMYRKTLGSVQPWLYPKEWNVTYNTKRYSKQERELNRTGAAKEIVYDYDNLTFNTTIGYEGVHVMDSSTPVLGGSKWETVTQWDKRLNRIPLRELFINVELIKEKINSSSNISEFIKAVLSTINTSTDDIFDLQVMSSNESNSSIRFVDRNFMSIDSSDDEEWFNNLFMFKPGSPDSIVKTYDISFSMPKGGLQNQMAIQSMGVAGSYFPISTVLDRALTVELLNRLEASDENVQIAYLPEFGRYRGEQLEDEQSNSTGMALNFYESDSVFTDAYSGINSGYEIASNKRIEQAETDKDRSEDKKEKVEDAKLEAEMEQAMGMKVAATISEYYLFKAQQDIFTEQLSTIMPATLSLSIYGISSLLPGDLIRVDYLPKKYRDNVFFQITKVSHNISTSTWTTELETVIRPIAKRKKDDKFGLYYKPTEIVISKQVLVNLQGAEKSTPGGYIRDHAFRVRIIDILDRNFTYIKYVFSFVAKKNPEAPGRRKIPGLARIVRGKRYYAICFGRHKWRILPQGVDLKEWDLNAYATNTKWPTAKINDLWPK